MVTRSVCMAKLTPDDDLSVQVRWAVHLARLRQMDLLFLVVAEAGHSNLREVNLQAAPKSDEHSAIRELRQAVHATPGISLGTGAAPNGHGAVTPGAPPDGDENAPDAEGEVAQNVAVSAKAVFFDDPVWARKAITEEAREVNASLFVTVNNQMLGEQNRDVVVERARLFEFLPCQMILCQGLTEPSDFSRVAVLERSGSNQSAALRLAADLVGEGGTLTALQVNPDVGGDAQLVGERRLDRFLSKRPPDKTLQIERHVAVNNSLQNAVQAFAKEKPFDILVVPGKALKPESGVGFKLGRNIPVAVVLTASPLTSRAREVAKEFLRQNVPQISRQDRVGLVERVQSSAEWNFDFVALMILSASIAAFGLMQNSAAVVIGAMLVAPLMTPILGLGLALVQGNLMLMKISAPALARGIVVALLSGIVIGLLHRGFDEPTREMFARTQPGLLDVSVAFLSGLAVAYAQSRPNLIAALPGVAIAAALVPPIVASGLLLSLWELELALGAFSLFLINMVAIVLASMLALFAVGIRQTKKQTWRARTTAAIVLAFSALIVWTSLNQYDVDIAANIPVGIEAAIETALGPGYRLVDIAIAYDELGYQLNLDVVGTEPIQPDVAKAVRLTAAEFYGEASRIRLVARISAEAF